MDNSKEEYKPLVVEKPGYLTSEFWFSVLTVVAILAKLFGIDVDAADRETLSVTIAGLVAGLVTVWGIVSRYIRSRAEVKAAALQAEGIRNLGFTGAPVNLTFGGKK